MGLFTARDANVYSTHFYLYTSWFMPPPNLAQAGLSDFQGNNFSIGPQQGIEFNGFGKHWFYALGVANGNLMVPAGEPPPSDISFVGAGRNSDSKDLYANLVYKSGGLQFVRSSEKQPDSQPQHQPSHGYVHACREPGVFGPGEEFEPNTDGGDPPHHAEERPPPGPLEGSQGKGRIGTCDEQEDGGVIELS